MLVYEQSYAINRHSLKEDVNDDQKEKQERQSQKKSIFNEFFMILRYNIGTSMCITE